MKTATVKKANRGHLKRAAKKGQLWVKCKYHMTDDYAYDAAVNCQKMDEYKKVYMREEFNSPIEDAINRLHEAKASYDIIEVQRRKLDLLWAAHSKEQREKAEDMVMMEEWDFKSASGHMVGNTAEGYFNVHSNLSYEYQIRA